MWLACRTEEEIADVVGQTQKSINEQISGLSAVSADLRKAPKVTFSDDEQISGLLEKNADLRKGIKVTFSDDEFETPIYERVDICHTGTL